jgi:hypothetical protein
MTQPTNTTSSNPLVRYAAAVVDVLRDLGIGGIASRLAIGAAAVGTALWIQRVEEPFWGAVALGVALTGVISSVSEVLIEALARTRAPHLWYAPGRVVHHLNLGKCQVLDYDDRPELECTWLLIQPLERGDAFAFWIEDGPRIAASNAELLERWDRGQL